MKGLFWRWFGMYRGLPPSVYILFFARIVNIAGNFDFPFLPKFLTDRLGIPAGKAGLYILVATTSFVPGSLIGGKLADHVGRKKVMLAAQLLGALCFVPCAFLGNSKTVIYLIIIAQFFLGAVHPCHQAMVADITNPGNRKAAFSLQYLGINLGFAVGPLVAGYLYTHHLPLLFLGDTATSLIAIALILAWVPESKPSAQEIESGFVEGGLEGSERRSLPAALAARPILLAFDLLMALLSFVYAQFNFTIPLFSLELFGSTRGPQVFGMVMSTNAVAVLALTAFITVITRELKPILNVSIAGLLYTAGFGILSFTGSVPFFLVSTVIWTVGEILSATNTNVYIANHTPKSHRGRFNSLFPIVMGTGSAVSPPIVGAFMERYGILMVWPLIACLGLVGAGGLYALWRVETREIEPAVACAERGGEREANATGTAEERDG
jgi:MFS family permease